MSIAFSPALRPSLPHGCRKRAFRQGQSLPGRFAGLDVHAVASGLIHSRATDEEASGGSSVKGICDCFPPDSENLTQEELATETPAHGK